MPMPIVKDATDQLALQLAEIEGVEPADAVELALKEALARRRSPVRDSSPLETARRLRADFGIALSDKARAPLPRAVFDDLSGEP